MPPFKESLHLNLPYFWYKDKLIVKIEKINPQPLILSMVSGYTSLEVVAELGRISMKTKILNGLIKTNLQGDIVYFNKDAGDFFAPDIAIGKKIYKLIKSLRKEDYLKWGAHILIAKENDIYFTCFFDEDQAKVFFLIQDIETIFKKLEETSDFLDRQMDFILKVMDNENDITITDNKGIILKVSDSYEGHFDVGREDIVGKSIYELERTGVFSPSVTALVLKEKKKVTITQKNKHGEVIMVTGVPVFDDNNDIQYVVSFNSIDIVGISTFQKKYEKLNEFMDRYYTEIKELRLKETGFLDIISKSMAMENLFKIILNIAEVNINILITGETGVGKNLIAKLIHQKSNRADRKYIEVNCGAIPDSLIESELFGYEKGSFTGASTLGKVGLIEMANGGTLFLDEIGELPYNLQKKLLQVIQDKKIMKVGATKYIDVDFRLIVATNKDLKELVERGEFREDLYYRLNVVPIHIPALRERKDDIPPLVSHFVNDFNNKYKKNKHFSQKTIQALINYRWSGNVRELENLLERLILTTSTDEINPDDLPEYLVDKAEINFETANLNEIINNYEKQIFELAYKKYRTTTEIAEALGIGQSSVVRKLQKHIHGYKKNNR